MRLTSPSSFPYKLHDTNFIQTGRVDGWTQEHASVHAQVHAVVCNWFGGLLAPVSVEDAWLQFGVPAYLTSLFVKNNEPSPNNGA